MFMTDIKRCPIPLTQADLDRDEQVNSGEMTLDDKRIKA